MKKKKIQQQPIRKVKHKGLRAAAQIYENILIIDCYKDEQYLSRYAITDTGEHAVLTSGKWSNKNIKKAFGYNSNYYEYDFYNKVKFDSEADKKTVGYFTKTEDIASDYHMLSEIKNLEQEHGMTIRDNAYNRKMRRIESLMGEVPVVPDDFESWIEKTAFKSSAYWFYDKGKNVYNCTACGKSHIKKDGKHNQEVTCSRTGRKCIIKKKNKDGVLEKDRAVLIERLDSGRSVARHFRAYKKNRVTGDTEMYIYEDVRVFFGKYEINKKIEPTQLFYGQYCNADELSQEWWDTNPANRRTGPAYIYPDVNLDGTAYEHLGIEAIAEKGWKTDINRIMRSKWKPFEYLVKLDMKKLVDDIASFVYLWNGGIYCNVTLNVTGNSLKDIFKIDGQRWNRLKQIQGGIIVLKWLQLEQNSGYKVKDETISFFSNNAIEPDDIEPLLKHLSIEKIKNHLRKQNELPRKSLEYWLDYMDMASKLGYDLNDEIVYKPKDIKYRHDELVDMINRADAKEEVGRIEEEFKDIRSVIKKTKKIYEYSNEKYVFVMPDSVEDIIVEGKNLHLCVSTTDRYFERINYEETYIGFVRDIKHPDISYYTIEFEPNGTVRQKRSEYNRQPNLPEITEFLKEWQKHIKVNKELKQKQKKSEILRIEGMKELRKQSPDFAKTLENDLLVV